MFKKTVQYEDLEGNTVQDTFYFHFNQLEVVEMMELEDLEAKVKRLTETENAKEAYEIFKNLIIRAYGEKTLDNRGFDKSPEIRKKFETSLAMPEIIFEFVQNPQLGAEFIEKCLPPKLVAAAKAAQAEEEKGKVTNPDIDKMVEEAYARQENYETAVLPTAPPVLDKGAPEKKFEDYTREELIAMPQEQFQSLVPSNPRDMTRDQLLVSFQRKNV
jgi:hypothetical protein